MNVNLSKAIRQGDVLVVPLEEMPAEAMTKLNKRLIRKGENGGSHQLETLDKASLFVPTKPASLIEGLFGMVIAVSDDTRIVHTEHKPVALTKGVYGVIIQREYLNNSVRNVLD